MRWMTIETKWGSCQGLLGANTKDWLLNMNIKRARVHVLDEIATKPCKIDITTGMQIVEYLLIN